jgi:hypothetical protein
MTAPAAPVIAQAHWLLAEELLDMAARHGHTTAALAAIAARLATTCPNGAPQ